jgi:hypothetical protein
MMQFSKMTMHPFTQLEMFCHGLKSMKVNFNIFLSQYNHKIWTSLNHSGQTMYAKQVLIGMADTYV